MRCGAGGLGRQRERRNQMSQWASNNLVASPLYVERHGPEC